MTDLGNSSLKEDNTCSHDSYNLFSRVLKDMLVVPRLIELKLLVYKCSSMHMFMPASSVIEASLSLGWSLKEALLYKGFLWLFH